MRRRRKAEQLAHLRRAAPGHEGVGKAGLRLQLGHGGGPLLAHHRGHQVAALGDLDGRGQHVGQRQAAEAFVELHPGRHGAGHGDAVDAALGRRAGIVAVFAAEVVHAPLGGRAAGGVQAVQLLAVPQDAEGVAAQAVADGLADGHGGGAGHGGIDRVATLLQHAQPRLRRQRVRGGDHVAREHGVAGGGVGVVVAEGHGEYRLGPHRGMDQGSTKNIAGCA